jgi:hypothetical protein
MTLKVRGRDTESEVALPQRTSLVMKGPITGKKYKYEVLHIPSSDVQLKRGKFNPRAISLFTPATINDLYSEILETKQNDWPVMLAPNFSIISGNRRSYVVSKIEGAVLFAHRFLEELDPRDEEQWSKSSDTSKPITTFDIANAMMLADELNEKTKVLSEKYGKSYGTIDNAKKLANIPEALIKLYPSVNHIPIRPSLEFSKYETSVLSELATVVAPYDERLTEEQQSDLALVTDDEFNRISLEITAEIKEYLKPKKNKKEVNSIWSGREITNKTVKTKVTSKGEMQIVLPRDLDDESAEKLIDFLNNL